MEARDYYEFVKNVKQMSGIDLSLYKEKQMKRRLTSLRDLRGFKTFKTYYESLLNNAQLYEEFIDRITINVSEFWRNPTRWNELSNVFIPQLLATNSSLKCWSAACSTGDEPYSLAMILAEHRALHHAKIMATDIDDRVLDTAREGRYNERSLRELPPELLNKYFTKTNEHTYVISKMLKKIITFTKHNLLLDSYEQNFDLIICRNVMIYFTDEAKAQIYERFAESLKSGGILFVGSTEQIFSPERFGLRTSASFFYEKI